MVDVAVCYINIILTRDMGIFFVCVTKYICIILFILIHFYYCHVYLNVSMPKANN